MAIYSGFSHWKWWFSIATLNYRRVSLPTVGLFKNYHRLVTKQPRFHHEPATRSTQVFQPDIQFETPRTWSFSLSFQSSHLHLRDAAGGIIRVAPATNRVLPHPIFQMPRWDDMAQATDKNWDLLVTIKSWGVTNNTEGFPRKKRPNVKNHWV